MTSSIDEFKLRKELQSAMKSGRYMVMITYIDEKEEKPFKHYRITCDFPREEIMPSILHHANELEIESHVPADRNGE